MLRPWGPSSSASSSRPRSRTGRSWSNSRASSLSKTIRIGAGSGFQGDRLEPAVILASQGELDYLALECLAERTIALAQLRKLADPAAGFDPLLETRMRALLPLAVGHRIRIVTKLAAADRLGPRLMLRALATE